MLISLALHALQKRPGSHVLFREQQFGLWCPFLTNTDSLQKEVTPNAAGNVGGVAFPPGTWGADVTEC